MLGIMEVKLVEDDSTLQDLALVLGPVCVLIGAILAAALAAWIAIRQQRKQLEHDRDIRRREHVRDALDEALELVGEAYTAQHKFLGHLRSTEARRTSIEEETSAPESNEALLEAGLSDTDRQLRRAWDEAHDSLSPLDAAITRLQLRFGITHVIPGAATDLSDAWEEQLKAFEPALTQNRSAEKIDADGADESAAKAYASLMTACSNWLREEPFLTLEQVLEVDELATRPR